MSLGDLEAAYRDRDPASAHFAADLLAFLKKRGDATDTTPMPRLANRPLDLYLLYQCVTSCGGLDNVRTPTSSVLQCFLLTTV